MIAMKRLVYELTVDLSLFILYIEIYFFLCVCQFIY